MNRKTIALPGRYDVDITDIQSLSGPRLRIRGISPTSGRAQYCPSHIRTAHGSRKRRRV